MNNFHALIAECELNAAVVETYRDIVRDKMLERICMFGSTRVFQAIAAELGAKISVDVAEATRLLWPTSHAIYEAAANTTLASITGTNKPSKASLTALSDTEVAAITVNQREAVQ